MSLYDTLGVPPDASTADIRKAYRKKAKDMHPDSEGGSEEKFHALTKAHDILSDKEKRDRYDRTGDDSNAPDDREAMLNALLVQLLSMAMENADVDHSDVVTAMKQALQRTITEIEKQQSDLLKRIKKAEKMASRMKKREGRTHEKVVPMDGLISGIIGQFRQAKTQLDREHEVRTQAMGVLNGHAYTFEPPRYPPSPGGLNQNRFYGGVDPSIDSLFNQMFKDGGRP